MTGDAKKALVPASSAALARTGSNDLTKRGLQDIEATERAETSRQRKQVSEMSEEEKRQSLLTSSMTGLPNIRAFEEREAAGAANVVAMSRVDWPEYEDDLVVLVRSKAHALHEVRLDAYHDECWYGRFLYRGDSPEELRSNLEKARNIFRARRFEISDQHGDRCVITGVDFTFGIGKSLPEAEATERLNRVRG